ncbi:hypothetical protein IscW_ISCW022237 [Ixodes scapularis]|uniref:Uncharacterized protein n=1 Tax=Ixodes scapularis TaxID=6945 RepID=B7QEP2_IXOSC|nr:hypothetical protein IscW_ISCW022237 [Ixodes scapularis]|eukprot:XP_002414006.1 hypothetical protein IscW_ISCW022237 [Ixodes scapularis]
MAEISGTPMPGLEEAAPDLFLGTCPLDCSGDSAGALVERRPAAFVAGTQSATPLA